LILAIASLKIEVSKSKELLLFPFDSKEILGHHLIVLGYSQIKRVGSLDLHFHFQD